MEGIAAEVSQKLKSAIKAKLMELGAYVDDELSNYVMVMVTNRRSKTEMDRELQLFLGANTSAFTSWLQSVWMKLEQVTVTNSGIDNTKRKKKIKKGLKSSSESDDDKKPKKKRKASASDLTGKEVKKKKPTKVASTAVTKSELFSEENLSDTDSKSAPATTKKPKNPSSSIDEDDFLSIKEDFESEFLSDNETFEAPAKATKPAAPVEPIVTKKSSVPKSDSSEKPAIQPPADKKPPSGRHAKEAVEPPAKEAPVIRRIPPPENVKAASNLSKIVLKNLTANNELKTNEAASAAAAARKALIRDRKLGSRSRSKTPTKVLRSKSRSPISAAPLKSIRQRSRSRLRSRSPSASPPRAVKRARGLGRDSGSPPRAQSAAGKGGLSLVIKSRSRSPATAYAGLADKSSAVVDARELINRKRAMISAHEHKDEKGSAKRQLTMRQHEVVDVEEVAGKQRSAISRLKPPTERLKGRERLKEAANAENSEEVENVEDDEDDDDEPSRDSDAESGNERLNHHGSGGGSDRDDDDHDDDEDAYFSKDEKKKKFGRFVVSQQGGTRSVTMRSALEKKASTAAAGKNEKADMRSIRRTVYSDENVDKAASDEHPEDDDVNDDEEEVKNSDDEKQKKRKLLMNQFLKYVKVDSQANVGSGKIVKVNRPKIGNVPAASTTLIRKAMADAHKSMSNTKEESAKRKDQHDNTAVNSNSRTSEESTVMENDPSDSGEPIITEENRASSEEMLMEADMEYDPEDQVIHSRDADTPMDSIEEYDPSKNVPQFVVTLTGLDPKLFPSEDIDMGDIDPMMDDIRLKPRSQERCKYYPNCLAGNQCLYYHPVIPCKMFPNCKYGNNCLYIHPKCKYDSSCTRYDCTFLHTSPRILPPAPARPHVASAGMNQPCKYYYNCTNPVCPYLHPKICRYDRYCTNKNCTFSHTSLIHVGGHGGGPSSQYNFSKLKWCRPKDGNAENKNGSNDAKTEVEAAVEN